MDEWKEVKHIEQKRKSKKIKKLFNLLDFVVVKQKTKNLPVKRQKVVKKIQQRGKVRKKKVTTLKKKILRERIAKHLARTESVESQPEDNDCGAELEDDVKENQQGAQDGDDDTLAVIEKIAQINLSDESHNHEACDELLASKDNAASKAIKHSRKFREYCNHFITPEIQNLAELVLKDLFKFQENKFQQNPVKAKANKRYVVGFKEVKKFLVVKRLKLVIIAPDMERNNEIDTLITEVKAIADQHQIPYIFSIKRRRIGYLLLKKVPVSVVGIFDYQGTNENVTELLKHVKNERIKYKEASKVI